MFALSIIIFLLSTGSIFISFLLRSTLDRWDFAWLVPGIIAFAVGILLLIIALKKRYDVSPAGQEKIAAREKKKEAYEEFKRLFKAYSPVISWPTDPYGVILKQDESILIAFPRVGLSEIRARRGSRGTGFTIMKGVRLYSGSSKSTDEMTHIDSGPLLVTDKRILFRGLMQTRDFSHKKIVSITYTSSGIMLNISGRKKAQLFTGMRGSVGFEYEGDVYSFKVNPEMFAGAISTIITQSVGS